MKNLFLVSLIFLSTNLAMAAQKSLLSCETEDKKSYVVVSLFKHDVDGTFAIAAEPITSSLLTTYLDAWSFGRIPRKYLRCFVL